MEAPPPGQSGTRATPRSETVPAVVHHQPRPAAIRTENDPRRQLPDAGMRVSWRSPTPIREEVPPPITAPVGSQAPSQNQVPERTGGKQAQKFWKNWKKPPWLRGFADGKGKSKGKDKGKNQNKGKGKQKSHK